MLANVPTAPEMAQVATSLRAARRRALRAIELGIGVGELDAEGGGFGVNAVAAADGGRILVLERTLRERSQQAIEVGQQQVGGAHQLHIKAGVEHVG